MSDLHETIVDWLHRQPDWLQKASEMLLTSGDLSNADIQSLVVRLKTAEGQEVTSNRTFDSLAAAPDSSAPLRLTGIGDVFGIEALAPRQPLLFGSGTLVAVYGHNGSGKSGYTRILKCACGKQQAMGLKPNVFLSPPAESKCRISYVYSGSERNIEWKATDGPIDDLRAIDIFDSDAATFCLERESEASYSPPAVALFKALARVCDRVKLSLQEEQNLLISRLPALPSEYTSTPAGSVYSSLTPDLDDIAVNRLTAWGVEDEERLADLNKRLGPVNPADAARQKRSTHSQLTRLADELRSTATTLSDESIAAVRLSRAKAQNKRRIATESAQVHAGSAKLDGVGADTWNALWEAARNYSATAYPGQSYPYTESGACCVLCQRELDVTTSRRLQKFEDFVKGDVEVAAKEAEDIYEAALDSLPFVPSESDIITGCQAAGLTEEPWAEQIGGFWNDVRKAVECLRDEEEQESAVAVEEPKSLLKEINDRADILQRASIQDDQDANDFDRDAATRDKLNLEAQRWISQQEEALRQEIVRLKGFAAYDVLKGLANSRGVSLQAGEIASKAVTQDYVDRFNRELNQLGAPRIKVELVNTRTERGTPLHQIRLKGVQKNRHRPDSVLSDGEQRIVALAAFLADVAAKPYPHPFIFDDPISSLDQDFEWHVAMRLARLAESRQVIVFTHRLSLYGAIEDAAKKNGDEWKKINLERRCIESFGGVAGHPADEAAWNANTKTANNILLSRLDAAKKAGEVGGADAYRTQAQAICTEYRKLLERTVEDDLLNQVVRRHRRGIQTDGRLEPLCKINREDCMFIDELMTKYSCYEHSQSQETPTFLPEESELRSDLERLKAWRQDYNDRSTEVAT